MLPLWEPTHYDNKETLTGSAGTLNLLSPPTDNSNNQHLNHGHMKFYCDDTQC